MTVNRQTIISSVMLRVVPAAALALFLVGLMVRSLTLGTLQKEIQANLASRSAMTAEAMMSKLDGLKAYAKVIAENDLIINSLIDYAARDQYLPTFFQSLRVPYAENCEAILTDYRGRMVASNTGRHYDFQKSPYINDVMDGGSAFELSADAMVVAWPVRYNGLPEGMFLVRLLRADYDGFFGAAGRMKSFAVFNGEASLLFVSDKAFALEIHESSRHNWFKVRSSVPGYKTLNVLCGIMEKEATAPYKKLEVFLIGVMFMSLAGLILGIYFSASLTCRPLVRFVELMTSAGGEKVFEVNLPENGPREISALAGAFNRLIRKLNQARAESMNQAVEAGRAQLSAMVLHNIGNAVTPLSVHIEQINTHTHNDIQVFLDQCYRELKNHEADLTGYVMHSKRGSNVFAYMGELIETLKTVNSTNQENLLKAEDTISYISEIISLQQNFAASGTEIKEKTDLNTALKAAIQIHRSTLEAYGIEVEMDLTPEIQPFFINKSRLLQILVNLLKNSCEAIEQYKASSNRKQIVLRSFSSGSWIGFEIQDTGVGIDPGDIESLFKFGRSGKGSSGLGLYYCRMFVEANRGTIALTSEGHGRGAVVTVKFNMHQYSRGTDEG